MGFLSRLKSFFSPAKKKQEQAKPQTKPKIDHFCSDNQETTILIVDDSKTQTLACEKWLNDAGYHTIVAYDGQEGIIKTQQEQPDLILMDIVMPKINGFQATRHLKRQSSTQHIPIVLISGEEQSSGKTWAKKLGACCFVVKPIKKEKLLRLTSRILEHYATSKSI